MEAGAHIYKKKKQFLNDVMDEGGTLAGKGTQVTRILFKMNN